MHLKGTLPLLILHLLREGPLHGYALAQQIQQQSDGLLDFKEGTLYPLLHSLEARGLIESLVREENGRSRRYYRLLEAGLRQSARDRAEWDAYVRVVNRILGEAL